MNYLSGSRPLTFGTHETEGPTRQRPKNRARRETARNRRHLTGGDFSGGPKGTGVFYETRRTYICPSLNRYLALATTASAMADCDEVPTVSPHCPTQARYELHGVTTELDR